MKAMTTPEYFRTQDELIKPFMSDESPIRKAGLTLSSLETKKFLWPETRLWQETGDAKLVARMMTEQTRAWSNFMFLSGKQTQEQPRSQGLSSSRPLERDPGNEVDSGVIFKSKHFGARRCAGKVSPPGFARPPFPFFRKRDHLITYSRQCRRILGEQTLNIPSSIYKPPSWIRKTRRYAPGKHWSLGRVQKNGEGRKAFFPTFPPSSPPPSSSSFTRPNSPRFANPRWRLNTRTRNHRKPTL